MYIQLHTTAGRPIVLDTNKMSNFRYDALLKYSNVSFTIECKQYSMFVSDSIETLEDVCREISNQEAIT